MNNSEGVSSAQPQLSWMTGWAPVVDENLVAQLSTPTGFAAYLNEIRQMGLWARDPGFGDLSKWTVLSQSDQQVVYQANSQLGTFTITGVPDANPPPANAAVRFSAAPDGPTGLPYRFDVTFLGAATSVSHLVRFGLYGSSAGLFALAGIAGALCKLFPSLMGGIGARISAALGNAVADAGEEAAEGEAEAALVESGIAFFGVATAVVAGVAAVVGIAAFVIQMLEKDFQLSVRIVNASSVDYLVVPNYYNDGGDITGAANSTALLNQQYQLPPSICKNPALWPLAPRRQVFTAGDPEQASEYTLNFQISGLEAVGNLLMLVECAFSPGASGAPGTLTPTSDMTGWTGLMINTHYEYKTKPAQAALFEAGNDLPRASAWWSEYSNVPAAMTGTRTGKSTTLSYSFAEGDPQPDPDTNAITWNLMVTITDNP